MRTGSFIIITLVSLFILAAAASADTYSANGGNSNGEWAATFYIDENGNMAGSIAGVVQGTLEPYTPSSSPQNSLVDATPVSCLDNIVYQVYTIDAENGQGFAGCSAVGAGGSTASTGASVTGGVLNVGQFAAVFSPGLTQNLGVSDFEAAAAGQAILDSYGTSVQAITQASGSNGGSSVVDAYVEGTLDGLLQVAGAGSGLPISTGIGTPPEAYGSIAFQAGDIGSGVVNYGSVRAVSTDTNGNRVRAYAEVSNGSIEFEQLTYGAGSLFTGVAPSSYLYAKEFVLLSGTQGRIATNAKTGDGSAFTRSNVRFSNEDADTGTIDAIARSEGFFFTDPGLSETKSVLREWNTAGTFDDFRVRAANQYGQESKHNPDKDWKAIAESTGKYNVKKI